MMYLKCLSSRFITSIQQMLAITFLPPPLFFSAGAASIWNDIIKIQLGNDREGL